MAFCLSAPLIFIWFYFSKYARWCEIPVRLWRGPVRDLEIVFRTGTTVHVLTFAESLPSSSRKVSSFARYWRVGWYERTINLSFRPTGSSCLQPCTVPWTQLVSQPTKAWAECLVNHSMTSDREDMIFVLRPACLLHFTFTFSCMPQTLLEHQSVPPGPPIFWQTGHSSTAERIFKSSCQRLMLLSSVPLVSSACHIVCGCYSCVTVLVSVQLWVNTRRINLWCARFKLNVKFHPPPSSTLLQIWWKAWRFQSIDMQTGLRQSPPPLRHPLCTVPALSLPWHPLLVLWSGHLGKLYPLGGIKGGEMDLWWWYSQSPCWAMSQWISCKIDWT